MQVVSAPLIAGRVVLLRLDIDVPYKKTPDGHLVVSEDYRLRAGLPTLRLCLENAKTVIVMGHVGRPEGKVDPELSVAPVTEWFENELQDLHLTEGKFHILENLRFEPGEDAADLNYAKELAALGDFYVNEAFSSHHPAASTTVLPTLLPHAAGLRFAKEVEMIQKVTESPKRPLVAVIGGAKIEDKLAVVSALSKVADAVLLGGKLLHEIKEKNLTFESNVHVGTLNDDGMDLSPETCLTFAGILSRAEEVVWSGPVGKFEDGHNNGNKALAEAVISSGADSTIGGGDTIAAMESLGYLDKFKFVSVGGGAMLEFLATGTLKTIEALS